MATTSRRSASFDSPPNIFQKRSPLKSRPLPAHGAVQPGSLLDIERLSVKEIESLLDASIKKSRDGRKKSATKNHFAGKRAALLFYEASTRTRVSFEFAAKALGASTAVVTAMASSIEKGESLLDTGYTLAATGADVIVIRHPLSGAPHLMERFVGVPVINAGDGTHEHPTQALLDAVTILESRKRPRGSRFDGLRVTIVGDIQHSRVARSNVQLLSKLGARICLCGPEELLPPEATAMGANISIERDMDRALRDQDVVMMLRIQIERLAGLQLDLKDYVARYQLTPERLRLARPEALAMHPGPMNRGVEITAEVADGAHSVIRRQVENGVFVRMAALERAFRNGRRA